MEWNDTFADMALCKRGINNPTAFRLSKSQHYPLKQPQFSYVIQSISTIVSKQETWILFGPLFSFFCCPFAAHNVVCSFNN